MKVLRQKASPTDILVSDTGYAEAWTAAIYPMLKAGRFYLRPAGTLGWAFPAAMGAQLAKPNERLVTHVSNFRPVKRVHDVLSVFAILKKEVKSRLIMVGDGPERSSAEEYTKELGLTDVVDFVGKSNDVYSFTLNWPFCRLWSLFTANNWQYFVQMCPYFCAFRKFGV